MSHIDQLTTEQIQILQSRGFALDQKTGFFVKEDEEKRNEFALIPRYGVFRIEHYFLEFDEETGYFTDFRKYDSKPEESLEEFLDRLV